MQKFILTALTVLVSFFGFSQGAESFTNVTAGTSASSYLARTWTGDNGSSWSATDSRSDQTLTGPAIIIRNGSVTATNIANGIGSITFSHQKVFTGTGAVLEVFVNGTSAGAVSPDSTVHTSTLSNINIAGAFNLEIKQTTTGLRVKIDDVSWTGFAGGSPCAAPASQPTALTFNNVTSNSLSGSFAAAPAADEYLAVLSTSSTITANPQDGITYDVEDALGGGTVIAKGNAVSFTRSNLIAGTNYYIFVFALNSACTGGPLYNTVTPLTGGVATTPPPVCAAPSATPGALTLFPSNSSVSGSFADATGADGYLVVRSNSSTMTFAPVNGITYTTGQTVGAANNGTVVSSAQGNTFTATGLSPSTQYYFYVYGVSGFLCTGGPLYNITSSNGTATTTAAISTGEPPGYYSTASGLTCADLKTVLKGIISNVSPKSYAALYTQYTKTDVKPNENGTGLQIWDIYSDNPNGTDPYSFTPGTDECGNYSNEGDCYNREHSFPQSWFGGGTSPGPGTDYHHIFPTDGKVNGIRSNYIYGEVSTPSITSLNGSKLGPSSFPGITVTVFEPIDSFKGDVARAFMYMVTRYENNIPGWAVISGSNGVDALDPSTFPSVDIPYLQLMLKWHHLDPVSTKEIVRNNGAYVFQSNRNPYIDHPEFADYVWNNTCPGLAALPVEIVSFSGKLTGNKVQLEWIAENELNFAYYEIERSFNVTSFKKIGEVKANNRRNYFYNDDADALRGQRAYYRLKKVDRDGKYKYTDVLSMHIPLNTKFTIYPNPATTFIQLQMNRNVTGNVTVQVTDITGKVLKHQTINADGSTVRLTTEGLSSGTYLVKLMYNGEQYLQKIVISK